jgi:Flp pilus assembly pilin Flp
MMNLIRNFVRDEKGEDLIEYGLLAAFVAALATALLLSNGTLKTAIQNAFGKAVTALNAQ